MTTIDYSLSGSQSTILVYEEMAAVSTHMVRAAQRGDWDSLVMLSRTLNMLQGRVVNDDESQLNDSQREHKAVLLRSLLADNARIREYTEGRMRQLGEYLDAEEKPMRAHQLNES